jgi:nucleotide-binding universal stress UspA family protein
MEVAMNLHHILAAADESEAGRQAVRSAIDLASRAHASVTVMHAIPVRALSLPGGATEAHDLAGVEVEGPMIQILRQWIEYDLRTLHEPPPVELGIAVGVPDIEIRQLAEQQKADLLVLGRKQRSQMARLLLGDTADSVARQSRIPCLFVPPDSGPLHRVLVALDGSERGMVVLKAACGFARSAGTGLRVVTVEANPAEPAIAPSTRLANEVRMLLAREAVPGTIPDLEVRSGPVVEQILAAVDATGDDVLAIGYHRGGLPGIIEAGSTARHLAHTAPCAVLTIPL